MHIGEYAGELGATRGYLLVPGIFGLPKLCLTTAEDGPTPHALCTYSPHWEAALIQQSHVMYPYLGAPVVTTNQKKRSP